MSERRRVVEGTPEWETMATLLHDLFVWINRDLWDRRKWDQVFLIEQSLDNPCPHHAHPPYHLAFTTSEYTYHVLAYAPGPSGDEGYLGCTCKRREPDAGEDWLRGSDLPDGMFDEATWRRILAGVVRNELRRVAETWRPVEDRTGRPLPEALRAVFARRGELTRRQHDLSALASWAAALADAKDPLAAHLNVKALAADLTNARRTLDSATPYAVCCYCGGLGCKSCRETGWMDRYTFKAAPADLKPASTTEPADDDD